MKNRRLRRTLAALTILCAAATAPAIASDLTTARKDTAWGAGQTADDTAWGTPPTNPPAAPGTPAQEPPVNPNGDTAWG
ncbi:hypothetical protein [Streptomyces sp. NPDC018584]|uniref:hypothetical protein n=1 Tax=unclassified Streptomyces TaxID=2593676 RepID=UPI0037A54773